MFAYQDFKKIINSDDVGLRLLDKQPKLEEHFDWEQTLIRRILDWILDKRLSLQEAFKLMDSDFDGVLTLNDLTKFLKDTFAIDHLENRLKLERLFRILDLGKTG